MNIGMLWLDDDKKRPFEEKIRLAADYYKNKYGRTPELCFVNAMTETNSKKIGRIEVETLKTILPNHFWLGMKS